MIGKRTAIRNRSLMQFKQTWLVLETWQLILGSKTLLNIIIGLKIAKKYFVLQENDHDMISSFGLIVCSFFSPNLCSPTQHVFFNDSGRQM